MLISTSRKPSQKTRQFCKNFSHATGSTYINRGKMNIREVILKADDVNESNIAIVNEIKGNPSKITFYNNDGIVELIILVNVSLSKKRLYIQPSNLVLKSEVSDLNVLANLFTLEIEDDPKENYIYISEVSKEENDMKTKDYNKLLSKIYFYNKFGDKTDFQINVRKIVE